VGITKDFEFVHHASTTQSNAKALLTERQMCAARALE